MNKTSVFILISMIIISTLHLSTNHAQDTVGQDEELPEGAKIRIKIRQTLIKLGVEKRSDQYINAVESVIFSPDGKTLAITSDRSPIHLWNATTGEYMQTLKKHTAEITNLYIENMYANRSRIPLSKKPYGSNVAFSPDGEKYANGSKDNTVRVWNTKSGLPKQFKGHTKLVSTVAFSPDGKTLASGSVDNTIRLWDTATGKQTKTITGHTDYISGVAFTSDANILASASGDGTIRLWEMATDKHIGTLIGHTGGIYYLLFNSDGTMLASVGIDSTVRIWDISTGEQRHILAGRIGTTWDVSFNTAGRIFACNSDHFTIRVWDVVTGKRVQTFWIEGFGIYSSAFSPDGLTLASGNIDREVVLWDLTPILNGRIQNK